MADPCPFQVESISKSEFECSIQLLTMESVGVFEHKDVKCNPEGGWHFADKISTPPGMPWVSRGWVGVKNIWKTQYSIIKLCFLVIFIACVPSDRMSIVFVHDHDVPLLVTGERDNTRP